MALTKVVDGVTYDLTPEEEAEVLAEWEEGAKRIAEKQYINDRKVAYPSIADQLDAIWKMIEANPKIIETVPEATVMLTQIQEVKALYPKPVVEVVDIEPEPI